MIQKIKLDFTHSVNWGPIIVDTKKEKLNKKDVLVGTEMATSCLQSLTHKYYFSSSLSDTPFVIFLPTFMSQSHTDFLSTLFENIYSLAFKLVLLNHFHGLYSTM